MKKFFETVVKFDTLTETGEPVKVTQQFLVDALSCTEAEAKTIAEVAGFVKGESEVTSAKISKYIEYIPKNILVGSKIISDNTIVIEDPANEKECKYYAAKVSFIETTDKGKQKKTPYHYIVKAPAVESAHKTVFLHMHGTVSDWELNNIVETKIVDILLPEDELPK